MHQTDCQPFKLYFTVGHARHACVFETGAAIYAPTPPGDNTNTWESPRRFQPRGDLGCRGGLACTYCRPMLLVHSSQGAAGGSSSSLALKACQSWHRLFVVLFSAGMESSERMPYPYGTSQRGVSRAARVGGGGNNNATKRRLVGGPRPAKKSTNKQNTTKHNNSVPASPKSPLASPTRRACGTSASGTGLRSSTPSPRRCCPTARPPTWPSRTTAAAARTATRL